MAKAVQQTEAGEQQRALVHDLRQSLFALRTGIDVLSQVRDDPARFVEVHELLQKEVLTASELLNQLLPPHNGS